MKSRCVICCAGPSLAKVPAEAFNGATVIGLSGAPNMRPDVRFDYWVLESECRISGRTMPSGVRGVASASCLQKLSGRRDGIAFQNGISFEELRASTGWTRCYRTLTAECILLAHHLGFKEVDLYGCDWSHVPGRPRRFLHESIETYEAVKFTGIRLLRHGGEPFRQIQLLHLIFNWQFCLAHPEVAKPVLETLMQTAIASFDFATLIVDTPEARQYLEGTTSIVASFQTHMMYQLSTYPPSLPNSYEAWCDHIKFLRIGPLEAANARAKLQAERFQRALADSPPEVQERHAKVVASMAERARKRQTVSPPLRISVPRTRVQGRHIGEIGEALKGHFPSPVADFDRDKVAVYGGKVLGQSVFFRPEDLQRYLRENPPAARPRKMAVAGAERVKKIDKAPCTNCGKPDPAKPFGSSAMVREELGGV